MALVFDRTLAQRVDMPGSNATNGCGVMTITGWLQFDPGPTAPFTYETTVMLSSGISLNAPRLRTRVRIFGAPFVSQSLVYGGRTADLNPDDGYNSAFGFNTVPPRRVFFMGSFGRGILAHRRRNRGG